MRNPGARQMAASRILGNGHRRGKEKKVVEREERGGEESVAIKVMKCLLRAFKIKKKRDRPIAVRIFLGLCLPLMPLPGCVGACTATAPGASRYLYFGRFCHSTNLVCLGEKNKLWRLFAGDA